MLTLAANVFMVDNVDSGKTVIDMMVGVDQ